MTPRARKGIAAVALLVALAAAAFPPVGRAFSRWQEANAVSRGERLAGRAGCFACHGPGGARGVPNPGARDKAVPAWDGGMSMMYVTSSAEVREYIARGEPERRRRDAEYMASVTKAKIVMPAYGEVLSAGE